MGVGRADRLEWGGNPHPSPLEAHGRAAKGTRPASRGRHPSPCKAALARRLGPLTHSRWPAASRPMSRIPRFAPRRNAAAKTNQFHMASPLLTQRSKRRRGRGLMNSNCKAGARRVWWPSGILGCTAAHSAKPTRGPHGGEAAGQMSPRGNVSAGGCARAHWRSRKGCGCEEPGNPRCEGVPCEREVRSAGLARLEWGMVAGLDQHSGDPLGPQCLARDAPGPAPVIAQRPERRYPGPPGSKNWRRVSRRTCVSSGFVR